MKELILSLLLWIGANSDFPTVVGGDLPTVVQNTPTEVFCALDEAYSGRKLDCSEYEGVIGMYQDDHNTIFLRGGVETVFEKSVLLHELIHALQYKATNASELAWCTAQLERDAYVGQVKWLREQGVDAQIDPLWLAQITSCSPYGE